jgi:cytochrome c oxidase assembly factor CtaG
VIPTLDACLRSWTFDPGLLAAVLLTGGVYLRGWLFLHRRDPERWHSGRLVSFCGGLTVIYLALASPIEPFAALLLQVHMLQHLLLMMVAPPLLWLGAPLFPLLRGLPRAVRVFWAIPLLSAASLRRLFGGLVHPLTALLLFITATWFWHAPPVYDLALRSTGWHYLQHVCFLGTALLFWYPIVRPYPARPRWSSWLLLPVLLLADVSNTVLSALLTFSDRVLYPYYAEVPRLGGLSAVEDQSAAGVLMWIPGSIAFLLPLFSIGTWLLSGRGDDGVTGRRRDGVTQVGLTRRVALPLLSAHPVTPSPRHPVTSPRFDLLRVPVVCRFLRWRHARLCLQLPVLLLAGLVIYDGLCGPQVGAMNLAGVLPWIHWRGLIILGLLAAGNVFCMGCPFLVPRTLARHFLPTGWSWPRRLRSKWLAVFLIVAFLWAYEALALWDRPRWTACLALGYFVAAFVVDGLFRGASFCKYLCPIGQFNFVQSLASPLEVKARDPAICASCRTKDCIRGSDDIPGCELHLYQPRKSSNLDCTFCLDCIHACPHDNIGILSCSPGAELWRDPHRFGVGRFSQRLDLAMLCLVLVFGAFVNAAWMTGPLMDWQDRLLSAAGPWSRSIATSAFFLSALVALPLLLVGSATVFSRRWARLTLNWTEVLTRYCYALVPLGFGMWLTHYSFHFFTSYATLVPTTQRFVADLGWTYLGAPAWSCACCVPAAGWLLRLEIVFLDLGLLLSLYTGYRIALSQTRRLSQALRAFAPWAILIVFLFALGIWIVFQPMQMRGTMQMSR